jgi:hypothetical protein
MSRTSDKEIVNVVRPVNHRGPCWTEVVGLVFKHPVATSRKKVKSVVAARRLVLHPNEVVGQQRRHSEAVDKNSFEVL